MSLTTGLSKNLKIAVFEDQNSFFTALRKFLQYMKDSRETLDLTPLAESEDEELWRASLGECSLALVDLELQGSFGKSPSDSDGLDVVLPRLRAVAPWLPAVLMSVYFVYSHLDLLRVAEGDFDAILPKDIFKECTAEEWHCFCEAVTINRIAATTGRSVKAVRDCRGVQVEFEMGQGVNALLGELGEDDVREAIKLMGLGPRLVLDLVTAGFSGLSVVKATVSDGDRDARWLLKVGRRLDKLTRECDAHHAMVIDGHARNMSAPLLYRVPVVWNGCGVIAYEFEEGSEPLRELARRENSSAVLERIAPMLRRFWSPMAEVQIVPRKVLDFGAMVERVKMGESCSAIRSLAAMVQDDKDSPLLDRSVPALCGRQHGDLHGLNVLVTKSGAMMIDFAHYRGKDKRGIPLLDVVKLAFDLWAFGNVDWSAESLLGGQAFSEGALKILLEPKYLRNEHTGADVSRFIQLACAAEGCRYLGYPDVAGERKEELRSALEMGHSLKNAVR